MQTAALVLLPTLVRRGPVLWLLTHAVFLAVQFAASDQPGPAAPIPVILLTGGLGLLDTYVRAERLLWANLGVGPGALFAGFVAIALLAELSRLLVLR